MSLRIFTTTVAAATTLAAAVGVAVSIEPAGGSQTGAPTDVQNLKLFDS